MSDKLSNIRRAILDRTALRDSYRTIFETPDGKRVLRHLMRVGFVTKSTFVAGDPHHTALNEGMRRIVLSIVNYAVKDHAELEKLTEESLNENPTRPQS
jgi:hypothetical protein